MNDMTAGPQVRPVFEGTFQTHDGVQLFYRHWPAIRGPARGAIVLFHRGHEHPARIANYDSDPLLSRTISVDVLLGLQAAADRVVADAQAITVPTQLLVSGADWVVRHGPQHVFFDRLGAKEKERHVFHGFLHDTLGERDR